MKYPFVSNLIISAGAALALSTPALAAQVVEPAPGQKLAVDEVVLIVDASSSLGSDFDSQRELTSSFAAGMPAGSYGVKTLVFGGGEVDGSEGAFDRSQIEQALGVSKIGKGTPLPEIIGDARSYLADEQGKIAVVIFSDGLPTSGGRPAPTNASMTAARRLVDDHPGRICIHTIQSGDSQLGESLLRQISGLTGCGSYKTASQLRNSSSLNAYQQAIFLGAAPLPAVSAAPPRPAITDLDGDGVPDARDLCAGTPSGVAVDPRGCAVIGSIRFADNSTAIDPSVEARLNLAAATLAQNDAMKLKLTGHASATGSAAANEAISKARAEAVRDQLVARGIDGSRIQVAAMSSNAPIAAPDMQDAATANRRVDVEFVR